MRSESSQFCPVCLRQETLLPVRPRGAWEKLQELFRRHVFRCKGCGRRVIRRAPAAPPVAEERRRSELIDLTNLRPVVPTEDFDHLIRQIRRSEREIEEGRSEPSERPQGQTGRTA